MSNYDPALQFEGGSVIYTADAQKRIDYLMSIPNRFAREPDDDEEAEFDRLLLLKDGALALWGQSAWDNGLSLISDDYWEEYAADQANGLYGEVTETEFFNHPKWAESSLEGFDTVEFDDDAYWGNGKR